MKQEKEPLRRAMTTFRIAYFGGIVCMVLAMLFGRPPVLYMLGGLGIFGIFGGLIYGFQAIRCPRCGGVCQECPGIARTAGKRLRRSNAHVFCPFACPYRI